MKTFSSCLLLCSCSCSCAAWAQDAPHKYGVTSLPAPVDQAASVRKLPDRIARSERGAYVSAMLGNGRAYGYNTVGERSMKGQAMSVRLGKGLPSFAAPSVFSDSEKMRADFVYYNEGHPDNNHRDGFSAQLVYSNALLRDVTMELGAGPYLSMNTTKINGVQINDSNVGALLFAAVRIGLDRHAQGLHLRLALNHAAMKDVHSSNALLLGIGKYFTEVPAYPAADFSGNPVWVGAGAGRATTNHSGTEEALSFSLEAKRYRGPGAASIAAFVEGDDGSRVDRRGIAAQGWLIQPLTDKWTVSVGAGPYVAHNARDSRNSRVLGLITLQADRSVSGTAKVFGSFSRVKTFTEKNDRDVFRIGVMKQFGG